MVALPPEAAAQALEATACPAQALRAVRPNRQVAYFSRVRIGAAPHAAIFVDTAANSGGEGHVEQRRTPAAAPDPRLPERPHVRVFVHDCGGPRQFADEIADNDANVGA